MASLNIPCTDHASRFIDPESAIISASAQTLMSGSSNAPKFGTLIPNRIFVGGIPSNTTEQELKVYFSSFGQVKDVKIINDRLGVAKGSYGFVTFENQEVAEKIIKNESETLIFKDRKLNIGHAIRKQQLFPRPDAPTALLVAGGAIPCGFQNSMTVFPFTGQDYSLLAQAGAHYPPIMLQQANGTTLYLSASPHGAPTAATYPSLSSTFQQAQALGALQQQHYQQTSLTNAFSAEGLNVGVQSSNSTNAMMAAAMAAAAQWPQSPVPSVQQYPLQCNQYPIGAQAPSHLGVNSNSVVNMDSSSQAAAIVAAAVTAQQQLSTPWRWPTVPQITTQSTNSTHTSSPLSACTSALSATSTTAAATVVLPPNHHQSTAPASVGPSAYLYSPLAGTGHEVMFVHQTTSPYTPNATSDYSTDHSAHSSSFLEAIEPISYHCAVTPPSRHSHSSGSSQNYGQQVEFTCIPPYAAVPALLDGGNSVVAQPLMGIAPHQPAASMLSVPVCQVTQQLITFANQHQSLMAAQQQQQQHKLFATLQPNVLGQNCPTQSGQYANTTFYGATQPIVLDVISGGLPFTQIKQNAFLTENIIGQQVENFANISIRPASQISCAGITGHSVFMGSQSASNCSANIKNRNESPAQATQLTGNMAGGGRNIENSSNTSTL